MSPFTTTVDMRWDFELPILARLQYLDDLCMPDLIHNRVHETPPITTHLCTTFHHSLFLVIGKL